MLYFLQQIVVFESNRSAFNTELTMLLAVWSVAWPVARVHGIVVQQGKGALLNGGRSVPTVPVSGTGGGVL